ncbi:hypothetical protein [Flavobacterium lindanitolerans]|uniref:hypothetical protein n=1 Tax=Flavobacterium lindanitolerans TaxID=428988 RepID=UPI002806C189|nr:hypothetical protein [Flavobacterium lindanitolerans]MDQ7960292.1 hypothetical protein [Flavobacterium lindanitolerans]
MKKIYILFLFSAHTIFAQDYSVEKSTFSFQTGFFGFWLNNESRLSDKVTLKTEIGLDVFTQKNNDNEGSVDFDALVPVITFEPRWYYNLEKRGAKGKNIHNNAANFIALTVSYHPDWFVITGVENAYLNHQVAVVPKWAMKRNIGKSDFTYELGAGLGYNFIFNKKYPFDDSGEVWFDLHARIGYIFKSSRKK